MFSLQKLKFSGPVGKAFPISFRYPRSTFPTEQSIHTRRHLGAAPNTQVNCFRIQGELQLSIAICNHLKQGLNFIDAFVVEPGCSEVCECKVKKYRWSKTYLNNEALAKSWGEKLKWLILRMVYPKNVLYVFGEMYERHLCVCYMCGGWAGGTD